MPAVLVHGVPDTPLVWRPVREHLSRTDVITPSLPGFGNDPPEGFASTKEAYADWLIAEIEAIGEPVDLVGHDWGGTLVLRAASLRPDLVRTLACGSCPIDAEYVWHPMAQIWQTPGAGEEMFAATVGLPADERASLLAAGGMPEGLALADAPFMDQRMADAILALYRSATQMGEEWQPGVEAMPRRPSVVLWGRDDPFVQPRFGERLAARLDAELVMLDSGHFWSWDRAEETAAALEKLWAG